MITKENVASFASFWIMLGGMIATVFAFHMLYHIFADQWSYDHKVKVAFVSSMLGVALTLVWLFGILHRANLNVTTDTSK